jgi:hypothetical protein
MAAVQLSVQVIVSFRQMFRADFTQQVQHVRLGSSPRPRLSSPHDSIRSLAYATAHRAMHRSGFEHHPITL